jgi:flavodoxin
MRTLVAYYSRTGNTKFVAEKIADQLNADLCAVIDKKNREGRFAYLTGGADAQREKLTEIESSKPVAEYDSVIVGSPVWAGKIAPAIRTFLVKNDLSNKQVAFFVTLGGDKPEKTFSNLKEAIKPKLSVSEVAFTKPLENREKAAQQITDWCNQIKKTVFQS